MQRRTRTTGKGNGKIKSCVIIYDRVNNTNKWRRHISILDTENGGLRSIRLHAWTSFVLSSLHWSFDDECQFYYDINICDLLTWFDALNSFFCGNPLRISFKGLSWFWAVSVERSGCITPRNSNWHRCPVQSPAKPCRHSCDRCHSQSYKTDLLHYTLHLAANKSSSLTGNTDVTRRDTTFD